MKRKRNKKIPHNEIFRNYVVEQDPHPGYRLFKCDFDEIEDEENDDGWV